MLDERLLGSITQNLLYRADCNVLLGTPSMGDASCPTTPGMPGLPLPPWPNKERLAPA